MIHLLSHANNKKAMALKSCVQKLYNLVHIIPFKLICILQGKLIPDSHKSTHPYA